MRPLVAAGSMTLTLYTAHLLVLTSGLLDQNPVALYVVMAVGALTFAIAWRRTEAKGPLEAAVAWCCGSVRDLADRTSRSRH